MAFYIPSKNCVFVHIPKTGGTSVLKWISENLEYKKSSTKHCSFNKWQKQQAIKANHFTVVRNPYARILSWFNYQGKMACNRKTSNNQRNYDEDMIFYYKKGFEYWLERGHPGVLLNKTILTQQTDYYTSDCLFVLSTENLNNEFTLIQDYFNVFEPIKHLNKSDGSTKNYRDYYNSNTKKIVSKLYEKDLDVLGYTF